MLAPRLRDRIHREGPITFAAFMEAALYDERDGFFAVAGGAGRAGADFVTSPETGSLFGTLVARALDEAWRRLGEPDPFVVVEAGARRGRLAVTVLQARPACTTALRYVLVELAASLRARQRELLPIEPPDEALGPFTAGVDPDDAREAVTGMGPIVTQLAELPAVGIEGVVIANELLDNLPVRVVERSGGTWAEVRVGVVDETAGPRFVEVVVPAPPALAAEADLVAAGHDVPEGARLPVPEALARFLESAAALVRRGEVVLVDYGAGVAELTERGQAGWLRTYRAHDRGDDVLAGPGTQDITCDVPTEYLLAVADRAGFALVRHTDQAEWLAGLGIEELAAAGAAAWRDGAHRGDLAAIAGRSRVHEAAALTDRSGLGAHRVVVLARG